MVSLIYQNMRETWEKKVMKFEREISIGLDARRKKRQGGGAKMAPHGIRVNSCILFLYLLFIYLFICFSCYYINEW